MPKLKKRGYLYHQEDSRKGRIHEAYDAAGGGDVGRAEAFKLRSTLERDGKLLEETTIDSWISDWNSLNGYHAAQMRKLTAGRHACDAGVSSQAGFSDEARQFGAQGISAEVRKKPVNVTIDANILAGAKSMNINLSQVLEDELRQRIRDELGRRWAQENKEFIDSYNAYIDRNGVFGEELLDLDDPPV